MRISRNLIPAGFYKYKYCNFIIKIQGNGLEKFNLDILVWIYFWTILQAKNTF